MSPGQPPGSAYPDRTRAKSAPTATADPANPRKCLHAPLRPARPTSVRSGADLTVLPTASARRGPVRSGDGARRMPRRASKRASFGSPRTNMRPSSRFGRKPCPRLAESRQSQGHPQQWRTIFASRGSAKFESATPRTWGRIQAASPSATCACFTPVTDRHTSFLLTFSTPVPDRGLWRKYRAMCRPGAVSHRPAGSVCAAWASRPGCCAPTMRRCPANAAPSAGGDVVNRW
jgi:hypothetical protein